MFANQDDPYQALVGERPLSEAQRAALDAKYHFDDPFLTQYWHYVKGLLTGDFGISLTNRSINDMLAEAWPVTIKLALLAVLISAAIAVSAGVFAGIRRGGIFDHATLAVALVMLALPLVALAPLAQVIFGVKLGWFPVTVTRDAGLYDLLLPALLLGTVVFATELRVTRSSVADNMRADYVRTAKAKGLATKRVIGVHVLRNSLIPVITLIGVDIGALMSGAIIVEGVFNIPGVGYQLFKGIRLEDGPLVVSFVSVLVIVFLVINLIVDLLYAALDPRIRYE